MNLIKCRKCGNFLFVDDDLIQRLLEEKCELIKDVKKKKPINQKIIFEKIKEINEMIKELRCEIRNKNKSLQQYYISELLNELKKCNYSFADIQNLFKQADEKYKKKQEKIDKRICEIYGRSQKLNINEYYNKEHYKDKTAYEAIKGNY